MTDDTTNDDTTSADEQNRNDESSAHGWVAGQTGIGRTTYLAAWFRAHRDESTDWIDPKGEREEREWCPLE